jgi:hypothetical protein
MILIVIDAYKYYSIVSQQFPQQFQPGCHHTEPFIVTGKVFPVNHLAEPFLHHGGIDIIVVHPFFITGVVRRIDINTLDFSGIERKQRFQGF